MLFRSNPLVAWNADAPIIPVDGLKFKAVVELAPKLPVELPDTNVG